MTSCSTTDSVTVTVVRRGAARPLGNVYKLVKSVSAVVHSWQDLPGTATNVIHVALDKRLSAPAAVASIPVGRQTYTELGVVPDARSFYYFIDADPCP